MARAKKLPNKPSALITLAMNDLNRVERLKNYLIDMDVWHKTYFRDIMKVCRVCFAGAIMSQTLKADPEDLREPEMYNGDTEGKLRALDSFRCGYISEGFNLMGLDESKGYGLDREIPHYAFDRRAFKLAMRKLIRDLEAAKL